MSGAKREVQGYCADCRAVIFVGEEYASISEGRPVYGRIGAPSNQITGVVKLPTIYRCGGCLRIEGPLKA